MESWKKRIKKIMPDRMVYAISVLKDFPTYLKATRDKIQMPDIKFTLMKKQWIL